MKIKFNFAIAALVFAVVSATAHAAAPSSACLAPASWYVLRDAKPRATRESDIVADMATRDVVLLGEQHDNADHHQWQLQTLAALHTAHPNMVIGFESFPRRLQPVLDQWVAGELSVQQFLERSEWQKVWSFPPELYLPLFQFARINRIPMIALNVERSLVEAVGKQGWDAVPNDRREGVSRPTRPSPAYESYLFEVYQEHAAARKKDAPAAKRSDAPFTFFVESQTTWDRAMAEALAARVKAGGATKPLVVGIMGGGHVRHGHGVPHQLRDLGVANVVTLLPVGPGDCDEIKPGLANAVFALPATLHDKPPPPRLGIRMDMSEAGVRIAEVSPASLAEQMGIRAGDEVLSVAGAPIKSPGSLAAAIQRQPPGTWLPLQVRRAGSVVDLVIKFPAR